MAKFQATAIVACALLATIWVSRAISNWQKRLRFASRNGCQPARRHPQKDRIFGIDLFLWTITVTKEKRRLKETLALYEWLGKTWQFTSFNREIVNTIDTRNIRAVMANNFDDWGLAPLRYPAAAPFMGRGVFTSDGSFWQKARAQVKPVLSKAQFTNLSRLESHLQDFIHLLPQDGSSVDVLPLLERLFTDVVTEFLLGESVGTLTQKTSVNHQAFLKAFEDCAIGVGRRILLGKLNVFFRDRKFEAACHTAHEYVDRRIDETIAELQEEASKPDLHENKPTLIMELAKQTDDRVLIRDQIINVLNAANDGAAIVISHILFLLSRDIAVQEKLRSEVDCLGSIIPSYEMLKGMKYLRNIINETLRLYPLVPFNNRMALKDTILPAGGGREGEAPIFVKKGTIYSTNSYVLHRSKSLWGEDAEEFKPERWETHRQSWEYQAFGGGARTCPGQALVLTEIGYTIVRLFQTFKRIESRDDRPWVENLKLTMSNANGVQMGFVC